MSKRRHELNSEQKQGVEGLQWAYGSMVSVLDPCAPYITFSETHKHTCSTVACLSMIFLCVWAFKILIPLTLYHTQTSTTLSTAQWPLMPVSLVGSARDISPFGLFISPWLSESLSLSLNLNLTRSCQSRLPFLQLPSLQERLLLRLTWVLGSPLPAVSSSSSPSSAARIPALPFVHLAPQMRQLPQCRVGESEHLLERGVTAGHCEGGGIGNFKAAVLHFGRKARPGGRATNE